MKIMMNEKKNKMVSLVASFPVALRHSEWRSRLCINNVGGVPLPGAVPTGQSVLRL